MYFDVYYDRNNEKYIFNSIKYIFKFLKKDKNNTINKYNELNIKNKNAICFGVECTFKIDTKFRKILLDNYENVLIVELGFINRKIYRSLSWNKFAGKSIIKPFNCDSKRFDKLNIKLNKLKINYDGYILVCGQLPWDSQIQYLDKKYNIWLNELFIKLREKTNKQIVFRFHPLYKKRKRFEIDLPDFVTIDKNKNLKDSFKGAYVTISYNSNSLIESLIYGCPFICFDRLSLVYDLGLNDIENIDNLYLPSEKERLQKLYDISYSQWTLKEFKNGCAIKYMIKLLKNYNLEKIN